jgi:hypothetical protein
MDTAQDQYRMEMAEIAERWPAADNPRRMAAERACRSRLEDETRVARIEFSADRYVRRREYLSESDDEGLYRTREEGDVEVDPGIRGVRMMRLPTLARRDAPGEELNREAVFEMLRDQLGATDEMLDEQLSDVGGDLAALVRLLG